MCLWGGQNIFSNCSTLLLLCVCLGRGFDLRVYGNAVRVCFFWFVRFMSMLFGAAVVRSIGNITRDFPFNWIVFASVSYNLRASHSCIALKIRTRNFSLAATGIITRGGVEDTRLEAKAKAKDTKKNPRPRPRTAFPRTDTLEAKDRNARGQKAKDQGHKRKCSKKKKVFTKIFQAISEKNKNKKRSSQKFFKRSPQKNLFQKIFQVLHKILTIQKIVLSSSQGQANF